MNDDSPNRRRSHAGRRVRGQSEIIGVVLLLALVLMGVSVIVTFGSATVSDIQTQSQVDRAEHAMTLFDSQAAMVALGDSEVQSVTLPSGGNGRYSVRENAGWIRVRHVNFTGNEHDETIYNESLGAVLYQTGDVTLAYQGGGVWRKRGNGSTMVSAPEFYYRGSTLTLPITRVRGSDGGSGDVTAHVESAGRTRRIFPNLNVSSTEGEENGAPYDVDDRTYRNPVKNGTVNVTVRSEYYQGWASYFRTRTEGNVSVNHARETATVELVSQFTNGKFDLPSSVNVRGMANHSVQSFTTTIAKGGPKKYSFSFWAKNGSQELEFHIYARKACQKDAPFLVSIYYHDVGTTHKWRRNVDPDSDPALDLDCRNETVTVNFLAASNLTYGKIEGEYDGKTSNDEIWHFDHTAHEMTETAALDQHTADNESEHTTFEAGDDATLRRLTNHYLSLMGPDTTLSALTRHAILDRSYGTLKYERDGGRYIAFLHVTENGVRVELTA